MYSQHISCFKEVMRLKLASENSLSHSPPHTPVKSTQGYCSSSMISSSLVVKACFGADRVKKGEKKTENTAENSAQGLYILLKIS